MTTLTLDDYTSAKMDALMETGNFASREEMVLQGLSLLEEAQDEEWPPEVLAALDESLADSEAGQVEDIEIVFERLRRRFAAPREDAA